MPGEASASGGPRAGRAASVEGHAVAASVAPPSPPAARSPGLGLARIHLRTGAYALARAELETAAGDGILDELALLDLAEARWRTDDLTGAGEAAAACLAAGRVSVIALVIAAEATAALGRPAEARRLATRAVELADGPLDRLFAGIRRSDAWPVEAAPGVSGPVATLAVPLGTPSVPTPGATDDDAGALHPSAASNPTGSSSAAQSVRVSDAPGAGRPGTAVSGAATPPPGPAGHGGPRPAEELAAARASLAAGDRADAAVRLAVVLRVSPTLAPAVLDIVAAEPGPEFDLLRGDALRLVGHETQARRSYAAAVSRLTADPAPPPPSAADDDATSSG